MLRHPSALLIGFGLMIACGTPETRVEPTSAPAAIPATAAPPTTPPATSTPGAPTPLATAASAVPTTAAAAAPKVSTAASAGLRLSLREDSSEARFRVTEQLTGRPLPGDAIGRTRAVTGTIALNPAGAIVAEQSRITVDLRTLRSDESRRDNFIQRNTLETSQYPNAEFVPREAQGLPAPLPTSGEAVFQLLGDLTVHGVTRPVTWEVTATFGEQEVTGSALTNVKLTDFNMTPPRVGPVLSIEDAAKLELDFLATRETPAGPAPGKPSSSAAGPAPPEVTVVPVVSLPQPQEQAQRTDLGAVSCEPTPADSLGPFYKPNAPVRASVGSGYTLLGTVRAADGCRPIPDAQVELWLANPRGDYDDAHRATLQAGPQGEYRFESNPPPPYSGRPPHIHLRVTAPGFRSLVTQHYPRAGQTEAIFDLVLVEST